MIVYAPLNFQYAKDRIRSEIESLPQGLFIPSSFPWPRKEFNPDRYEGWSLGTREMNENVSRWYISSRQKHFIQGTKTATHNINATWLPEQPSTAVDTYLLEEGEIRKFGTIHQKPWEWREDVPVPYMREVISQLPFEYVQLVRIIVTHEGNFCPVHQDESRNDPYYALGFGKINLNVSSGDQPLQIRANGQIYNADADAFYLNASFPHGVAPVTSRRIQIQVSGKLRPDWFAPR